MAQSSDATKDATKSKGPQRGGPEASPGFHLWHATLAWKAELADALDPYKLTPTQFFLLGAIGWQRAMGESPKQSDVARISGLDAVTTSHLIRALEKAGLVHRSDDPADTRSWRLSLTEKGGQTVKASSAAVRAVDREFFSLLGPEQPEFVVRLRQLGKRRRQAP